jgi:hypothetical protein
MVDYNGKIQLRQGLLVSVLLLVQLGQGQTVKDRKDAPSVICAVRTERKDWSPTKPSILYVTVESFSDSPMEIPLWSHLSLAPASPTGSPLSQQLKDTGRLGASVDASALHSLSPASSTVTSNLKGDGSIRLRLIHKGEKANFTFDADDLIWDFEAVSRTPALKLFSVAKPGVYDLQFHMWWETGACESAKVRLTILPDKPKKK